MISCIDLFCGLGGLTHGLQRGGVRVVAGVDVDSQCHFPYEVNNSAQFVLQDVAELTGSQLADLWAKEGFTMLAGCAPCQPFSTYARSARKSRVVEAHKWDLVGAFGRLVKESQPHFVTMENVAQLLDHPIFDEFCDALSGYEIWHEVIECADFGVPQTRKRLVLLASRLGPIQLTRPPHIEQNSARTVRQAIAHLKPLDAGDVDPKDQLHAACKLSELNLKRIRASAPGGTWRDWDKSLLARCHQKKTGETYPSVYGRMEWDGPAPTITTQCFGYGNGRFGHPEQDRAITLREAAILQTFPESYRFLRENEKVTFSNLGRLIGNAVPVRLGEVIAFSFLEHIQSLEAELG